MLNTVGTLFLIFFCFTLFLDVALTLLNMRHMGGSGSSLPPVFKPYVDGETYRRSVAYNRDEARFGLVGAFVDGALLIALIYFGGFDAIDNFVRSFFPDGYFAPALGFAGAIVIIKFILGLPFDLYDTFVIEERHGFNRTTPKLFVIDFFKGLALLIVIGVPLYLAVLWFMAAAGPYWWLWTWIFLESFQILMVIIYPIWIAPLFNKFKPLEDGPLKDEILKLSEKAEFPLEKIFVMDGSKRSSHSNAYFTGLGKKKRIVLFDTLLNQMDQAKIVSVLAHEIGHYKLKHIRKSLIFSALISLAGLWILSLLMSSQAFYHGLGFTHSSNYAALIIFSMCASTVSFLFKPIFTAVSRRHEYQADRFAVEKTGDRESMAEVIVILTKENLSNLNPHPWYSFFHYSHPAPVERVNSILQPDQAGVGL